MGQAKTDYDPENYNPDSLANIMQFITADLMIAQDIEGAEAFAALQPEIAKIRRRIMKAYGRATGRTYGGVSAANIAEGVLLWLREGATVRDVLSASQTALLKRGKACVRK